MKYVAYVLGSLQIALAFLALISFAILSTGFSVVQEMDIVLYFGFGSTCLCLGGVMGAVERQSRGQARPNL